MKALLNEELSEVSENRSFLPHNYQGNQQGVSNFLAPGFNQQNQITKHMNFDPLHVEALGPPPADIRSFGGMNFMGLPTTTLGNMAAPGSVMSRGMPGSAMSPVMAGSAMSPAMAGSAMSPAMAGSAMSPAMAGSVMSQAMAPEMAGSVAGSVMSPTMAAPEQASVQRPGSFVDNLSLRNIANLPTSNVLV